MDAANKVLRALRSLNLFNALFDDDDTHWKIMTTLKQMTEPILLDKSFVESAAPEQIAAALRELLRMDVKE